MLEYTQITSIPEKYLQRKIDGFLKEDEADFDITSIVSIAKHTYCEANIESQSECVFVGYDVIKYIFNKCDVEILVKDGDLLQPGDIIANIKGKKAIYILSRERVMLNIIQRLSGIATTARKYSKVTNPYNVKVFDTRKTTPGLRLFEKYAVHTGGAYNHRYSLATNILVKDNHIKAAGGIEQLIANIKKYNKKNLDVELEVDTIEQLQTALTLDIRAFLLDNMKPDQIRKCIDLIRSVPEGDDIFVEASGGITFENLEEYAKTGVNAISVGALTHRIVSADIHMNFL